MVLDNGDQRFNDTRFGDQEQQRKCAVAAFVVCAHEILDRFVDETGVGESGADAAAFFRRTSAQRVVYQRRGLVGIEFVKIAHRFLPNVG